MPAANDKQGRVCRKSALRTRLWRLGPACTDACNRSNFTLLEYLYITISLLPRSALVFVTRSRADRGST